MKNVHEQPLPPQWELDTLSAPPPAAQKTIPLGELDTPENIRLATAWLETKAPKAISNSVEGGNNTSYWVACRVKDYGISESMIPELLRDHWNERNEPSWDWEELQTFAGNAYRH